MIAYIDKKLACTSNVFVDWVIQNRSYLYDWREGYKTQL